MAGRWLIGPDDYHLRGPYQAFCFQGVGWMAKYDPLHRYLRRQSAAGVVLTFSEVENLLTALLSKISDGERGGPTSDLSGPSHDRPG